MLSRSCLDLLNLFSVDDYGALRADPKRHGAPWSCVQFRRLSSHDLAYHIEKTISPSQTWILPSQPISVL
ncbi:hypothetical protein K1719_002703 [Acacia pycnantha]|nr:hypothetical protein K1719_002703 [Acacia pycnantha]